MQRTDSLGQRIRAARLRAGLSARKISRDLGYSATYITEVERGNIVRIPIEVAERLAAMFGESASSLLGIADSPPESHTIALHTAQMTAPVEVPVVRGVVLARLLQAKPDPRDVEAYVFTRPGPADRNLIGVRVDGNGMEPEVSLGDYAIVDRAAAWDVGDMVAILQGEQAYVRRLLRRDDGGLWLTNHREPALRAEDVDRVLGVVVEVNHIIHPQRSPPGFRVVEATD